MRRMLLLSLVLLPISYLDAQDRPHLRPEARQRVSNVTGTPAYQVLNANRFLMWHRSDGQSGHTQTGGEGVYYPRGTAFVVYQDGILWAGKAYLDSALTQPAPPHTIRVGGQTYNVGTRAGWVNGFGSTATPADINDPRVRIYKIRRDFAYLSAEDLAADAADFFEKSVSQVTRAEMDSVRNQYERDWREWPVERGAPYIERNGIPGYQPPPTLIHPDELITNNYDEPGIAGADPDSPADQAIFTVYNDLNPAVTAGLYGSYPLGLEVQSTLWAYKRTGGVGNVVFQRVRLINKGGVELGSGTKAALYIDSLFLAKWVDSDLGFFGDDLLGCDTIRQMGYTYNAYSVDREFQKFNLPPPAVGWSLLQGPVIQGNPTDSAFFDFRVLRGKKNLRLSSYSPGTGFSDPPFSYEGALRWWRWIQGYLPDPSTTPWRTYPFPPNEPFSFFPLGGDPVTQIGFIDGRGTSYSPAPGDRRFSINTGPFRLAPGDTQEVIIAVVGGLGADRLTSISAMRFNYRYARQLQATRFASLQAPAQPVARGIGLNNEIILEWGSNLSRVQEIEQFRSIAGHRFEGYAVYQLPSVNSPLSEGVRIATFDVVDGIRHIVDERFDEQSALVVPYVLQEGTDSGIQRFLRVTQNALSGEGQSKRLFNGQEYVFAVTAYTYTADVNAAPRSLESPPAIVAIRPQIPFGTRAVSRYGDTLATQHTGRSEGKAVPIVIDPFSGTGDIYRIGFEGSPDSLRWYLLNVTKNARVVSQQPLDSSLRPIVEGGILLELLDTPKGLKGLDMFDTNDSTQWGWKVTSGERRFTWSNADGLGFEGFRGAAGWASPNTVFGGGTPYYRAYELKAIEIRLASAIPTPPGSIPSVTFDPNQPNVSYAYRYGRNFAAPPARPEFAPYIVNPSTGYAYQDFTRSVPLAVYDIEASPPRRLAVGFLENNATGGMVDGKYFPPDNSINNITATGPREWLFVFGTDYSETPDPAYQVEAIGNRLPIMYFITWTRRGNVPFTSQDAIALIPNHPFSTADMFEYRSPAPDQSPELRKASAERVGVFPNPYYAGQTEGPFRQGRFVTFTNLPRKATIRILNLAGHVVRKFHKDDPSQFFEWDLRNSDGLLVASGIYLCYIEMPEVGVTKVLKLAIIQDEVLPSVQ